MRFRLLPALSSLTAIAALLVACGKVVDPIGEPVDPSTDASFPDGAVGAEADAHVEPSPDAQADGSIVPDDGSIGPVDGSADGGPDAGEPACVEGDVTVLSPGGAAALASITCIHGSLTIDTTDSISLPRLREVSGSVVFRNTGSVVTLDALEVLGAALVVWAKGISTLSLPHLRTVAGTFVVEGASVSSIDAPQLAWAGKLEIARTQTLQTLSLPALKTIAGSAIFSAVGLTQLSLPELVECGEFRLDDAALTTLRLPELKKATGRIWVQPWSKGMRTLASVAFPNLEEAESIRLGELPELGSIDLARLKNVTNELLLFRAPRVTQLSLPSLTSVGTLSAYELATITTVSAPLLQGSGTTVITIGPAPMLSRVDLSAVTDLEGVQLQEANRLTTFSLPAATAVKWVEIANLSALTSIAFPALESVSSLGLYGLGKLASVEVSQLHSLNALVLDRAPKLVNLGPLATVPTSLKFLHVTNIAAEALVFPNLVEADNLFLSSNYALTSISFPALARVSTGNIRYCPELPSCSVDALNTHLTSGRIDWYALAPCTP